jgi:NitT/TauT family transport system permease protein
MSTTELRETRPAKSRWRWFAYKGSIPAPVSFCLGAGLWLLFFAVWSVAAPLGWVSELLLPGPDKVISALYRLLAEEGFLNDIVISVLRVLVSFAAVCLVAVPLGILMGTFKSVEALFNPFVSAWRYLPAPSFVPILLMWFGTGEGAKIALLFIGVVWFLTTAVMDQTREVRAALIETALTLGGSGLQVLRTVVVPAAMPGIVTSMRQMFAVSWTYLVVAEIVASTDGIGAMMMRARRFLHTDEIVAGIVVIGLLGLAFDLLFRLAHRRFFPYLEEHAR